MKKAFFLIFLRLSVLGLVTTVLAGCAKRQTYQVVLGEREAVEAGAPVYVDDVRAGRVASVGEEGGERVANLSVESASTGDRMREGAFRVEAKDRVQLITREVEADAPPLAKGARIPTRSRVAEAITRYAKSSTFIAAGVALAAFVVVVLVFRALVSAIGLIICSALGVLITQALYLYLAPWIGRIYERFPPPSSPETEGTVVDEGATGVVGNAINTVSEVLVSRPDPRILAWCATFILAFIALNLVLGKVAKVWKK